MVGIIIVIAIVVAIIILQTYFFVKNQKRLAQFSEIFNVRDTWGLRHNPETGLVDGLFGSGNEIFVDIIDSINKYLEHNAGSVIEFGLLKDAVDRHCDAIEEDIHTLTPLPLYWGLAGTMAGVIVGLLDLLFSGAIGSMMDSTMESQTSVGSGIVGLLGGVAAAMFASIFGIVYTTINSIRMKKCKLEEEEGKNSFLAWMQAELLPKLPSDTSEALNNMVVNLNRFNDTFSSNTARLGVVLEQVNTSYANQAEIIKYIHDMDIMKMARANVKVLSELQECTDKLEQFNQYLLDINGYTEAIHRFETMFGEREDKLVILEEIRDFFLSYKGSISQVTTDADNTLRTAMASVSIATESGVNDLTALFTEQNETIKGFLSSQKESFLEYAEDLKKQFKGELNHMPQLSKQLAEISSIPSKLDNLINRIDSSNRNLAQEIKSAIRGNSDGYFGRGYDSTSSGWMKITGWIALIIIACSCVFGIIYTLIKGPDENSFTKDTDAIVETIETIDEASSIISDSATDSQNGLSNFN